MYTYTNRLTQRAMGAAVVGGVVVAFLLSGRPQPGLGWADEAKAAQKPPAGGDAADAGQGLREVIDEMPIRKVEVKYKLYEAPNVAPIQACACRRVTPQGSVYYIEVFGVRLPVADAAALAAFFEDPIKALPLPPEARVGINRVAIQHWVGTDLLGNGTGFSVPVKHGKFIPIALREGLFELVWSSSREANAYWTEPTAQAIVLRGALQDIETLKAYPPKR